MQTLISIDSLKGSLTHLPLAVHEMLKLLNSTELIIHKNKLLKYQKNILYLKIQICTVQ